MEETLKELTLMVRAIYDQQLVMNAKMDGLEKRVSNIEGRLEQIECRMEGLEQQIDQLESHVDSMEQRMDKLASHMDLFASRMDRVELKMDEIAQQMETHLQFPELIQQSQAEGLVRLDRMESLLGQKLIRLEQENIDTQERLKYIRTVLVRHDEEILALGLKRTV